MDLAEAQRRLALYKAAEEKVLNAQSYSIGGRSLTKADAQFIAKKIDELEIIVTRLTSGRSGPKARGVTPA